MKRRLLTIMLLGLMVSVASFAGIFDIFKKKDKVKDEKVKISFMTRFTGADTRTVYYERWVKEFEELYPNVEVENLSISEETAYNNKLKTLIATGSAPGFFYYPGVAGIKHWAENGVIMEISELTQDKEWAEGFVSGTFNNWDLSKYGVEGKFGVPFSLAPEVMFYNKRLFAEAGITETPKTMEELYVAFDKLNAIGVTPWGAGARSNWRTGHIHNNVIYKTVGVEKVKELGTRDADWTEDGVVESLQLMKDFKAAGAFEKGFEGIDYDSEKTGFFTGKYAMVCNGAWMITDILKDEILNDPSSDYNPEDYSFFPFPYLSDRPEYKDNQVLFTPGFFLDGNMKGEQKEYTIKFLKYVTDKERQQQLLDGISLIGSRKDLVADSSAPVILQDMIKYLGTIEVAGGDYFNYDPNPAMIDRSRSAIVDMLIGETAEQTAQDMKDIVDAYVKNYE